jgi:hypothetical protein
MAKKKKGKRGRPAGSKNRKGGGGGDIPTPLRTGANMQAQIASLQREKKNLSSYLKRLDKAISILRQLGKG